MRGSRGSRSSQSPDTPMNKSQEQAARSKEAGWTHKSKQPGARRPDGHTRWALGRGWVAVSPQGAAGDEGTCGPRTGWVRSAPHPELPSPDFCLEMVGEAEVRFGCKMGTFRPFSSLSLWQDHCHCRGLRASEKWTRTLAPGLTCLVPFHGSGTPYPCGFGQNSFPCN